MEIIKKIRDYVEGMFNIISEITEMNVEQVRKTIYEFYGNEELSSVTEYINSSNDIEKTSVLMGELQSLARQPERIENSKYVTELLDVLIDENDYVSFEKVKNTLGDDYKPFLVAYNLNTTSYELSVDKTGFKKLKLVDIAKKVMNVNTKRLFTPEEVFAQYVEYYQGFELEIDPIVLTEIIERCHEDSPQEYNMYTICYNDYINLTEINYFYYELRRVFIQLLESTDDLELVRYLSDWMDLYGKL